MRRWFVSLLMAVLVASACEAIGAPELTSAESAWCDDHALPETDGSVSVSSVAREMNTASSDMEQALAAMDAAMPEGAAIMSKQVQALAAGDTATYQRLQADYQAWDTDTMAPLRASLAAALVSWRSTAQYVDACRAAYQRRGTTASSASPTPTPASTGAPTLEPTASPTAGAVLVAGDTINYTSSTYVGRTINLKVTVRNRGTKAAGKITMEIEGIGFSLKAKAPLVGCVPNCKGATGAEGVAYAVWTGPAAGKSRSYTAQLKAKASGTFKLEVRLYEGGVGAYTDTLGDWTIRSRVRP